MQQGDRINNYLLEERVGAGSFGEVWRARHHVFDEVVAIKIATDKDYVRNLQREGVAVHGLRHPNIVRAIDLDPYADPPYFIMEYIDGPSLRQVIDRAGCGFPLDSVVAVFGGILHALCAAHDNNLIHRDLKPANVLLQNPPTDYAGITQQSVRVTDFGLGQVSGSTRQSIMQSGSMQTQDGRNIAGTLAYMSPEQKVGDALDARSDLYACGILLFEMLTGERPCGSELPSSMRQDTPHFLDDIFRRCYARLDRRFNSAREVLDALSIAQAPPLAKPIAATMPPPPPPPPPTTTGSLCPGCHKTVQRDDQFCIHCGKQMVASVPRCSVCSAFVHLRDQYCIFCGSDLRVLHA